MRGSVPAADVDPTLDIATDGQVVALLDGDSVVCLDYETGGQRWRAPFPLVEADADAGRIRARQKVWTGTMIVKGGVVLHASPHQLAAFSTETGEVLWVQPKKFLQHLWYEWKDVFVIEGLVWTWSAELAREKLEGGGVSTWPVSINGYELLHRRATAGDPTGQDLQDASSSPLLPQQGHAPVCAGQSEGHRVRRPDRWPAFGAQLGARDLPHGHDAGQRTAVCPAASVPVLHRRKAERLQRAGSQEAGGA